MSENEFRSGKDELGNPLSPAANRAYVHIDSLIDVIEGAPEEEQENIVRASILTILATFYNKKEACNTLAELIVQIPEYDERLFAE